MFNMLTPVTLIYHQIYPPVQIIGSFTLRMHDDDVRPTAINTIDINPAVQKKYTIILYVMNVIMH